MIARISGTVVEQQEKGVVIETGGIGYMVLTPAMLSLGETVTLYTHLIIRDDAHELYGFQTSEEKLLFNKLISVSSVGPKTALHILTLYPLQDLVRIITSGDAPAIALVPGVGKKTAEKIVIDLKDKLSGFSISEQGAQNDLVEALLSLGYKEYQIRSIIPSIDTTVSLQKQIASALQLIKK